MLCLARNIQELKFGSLMEVYIEGNQEKAEEYPDPKVGLFEAEQEFYQYLVQIFFPTEGAFYAAWQENGRYCSALRLEPYEDGFLLEALETVPELRKMGYASKLIRAVQQLPECETIFAHVSKKNAASLATHRTCGFQHYLDYAVYIDGSRNDNAVTLQWKCGKES